jgi:hypothetical protein
MYGIQGAREEQVLSIRLKRKTVGLLGPARRLYDNRAARGHTCHGALRELPVAFPHRKNAPFGHRSERKKALRELLGLVPR